MDYYIYNPVSYHVRSNVIRRAKKMKLNISNKPWQRIWYEFLMNGTSYGDYLPIMLFIENNWLKNPICLMPDSSKLIEQLLNTNFEGQIMALRPFTETFAIAIPKRSLFNNHVIQGIFVSYLTLNQKKEFSNIFNKEYSTNLNYKVPPRNESELTICYEKPEVRSSVFLNIKLSELKFVLSAKTIEEYTELTNKNGFKDSPISYNLNLDERKTQFDVLKFVVAFIVYIGAHQNAVKFTHDIKMTGSIKGAKKAQFHTVYHFKAINSVRPHYRNLRDSRFYKGEWSTWEQGSRWIPVNMETARVNNKNEIN